MICLDNDAFIAAHQENPPASSATHTARVRAFVSSVGLRVMVPSVALSEYLYGFDAAARVTEVQAILRRTYFLPAFDQLTAEIAAGLGRGFTAGRPLSEVAKSYGADRISLKADLLIVATAVQHKPQHFVTNDPLTLALAKFAGLTAHRLSELPDPAPSRLPTALPQPTKPGKPDLFAGADPAND